MASSLTGRAERPEGTRRSQSASNATCRPSWRYILLMPGIPALSKVMHPLVRPTLRDVLRPVSVAQSTAATVDCNAWLPKMTDESVHAALLTRPALIGPRRCLQTSQRVRFSEIQCRMRSRGAGNGETCGVRKRRRRLAIRRRLTSVGEQPSPRGPRDCYFLHLLLCYTATYSLRK